MDDIKEVVKDIIDYLGNKSYLNEEREFAKVQVMLYLYQTCSNEEKLQDSIKSLEYVRRLKMNK